MIRTDPTAPPEKEIAHYHGDAVRRLFIASAILSLVIMPLWGNILPFGSSMEIGIAIFLVLLAGLTNPHGPFWIYCDAVFSVIAVFLLQSAAIFFFSSGTLVLFLAREAEAVMFLFALYYSIKTARAIVLHKVGIEQTKDEFETN